MRKASEPYLTYDDWADATRRFESGARALFEELVSSEPVLAEAVAQRTCELSRTVDVQDLTPEVKSLMKAQHHRLLLESMRLMRRLHEKVLEGLLPVGAELRVRQPDDGKRGGGGGGGTGKGADNGAGGADGGATRDDAGPEGGGSR